MNFLFNEQLQTLSDKRKLKFVRGIFFAKPALKGKAGDYNIIIRPLSLGSNIETYRKKTRNILFRFTNAGKNKYTAVHVALYKNSLQQDSLKIVSRGIPEASRMHAYKSGNKDFDGKFTVSGNTDLIIDKIDNKAINLILKADTLCRRLVIEYGCAECAFFVKHTGDDRANLRNLTKLLGGILTVLDE
jgi:hypothetical protein